MELGVHDNALTNRRCVVWLKNPSTQEPSINEQVNGIVKPSYMYIVSQLCQKRLKSLTSWKYHGNVWKWKCLWSVKIQKCSESLESWGFEKFGRVKWFEKLGRLGMFGIRECLKTVGNVSGKFEEVHNGWKVESILNKFEQSWKWFEKGMGMHDKGANSLDCENGKFEMIRISKSLKYWEYFGIWQYGKVKIL